MADASPLDPLLAHRSRFKGFLAARLGSESDAEDVLQDGFIKAAQRLGEVRDDDRVIAWFYQVLRHAMIDHVRSRSAARQREQAWLEHAGRESDDGMRGEACACFEALLPALNPREAELLRRVELQDEPVASAAASLGITANHAGVILHRARRRLRQRLEQFCGECAATSCLDCDCP